MSEQKLDMILDIVKEHKAESHDMHEKLDTRLRQVEETQAQQKGAFKILTFLGLPGTAALATLISKLLQ